MFADCRRYFIHAHEYDDELGCFSNPLINPRCQVKKAFTQLQYFTSFYFGLLSFEVRKT